MAERDGPAPTAPRGSLAVKTVAMPADTNPAGDIFGGWIMAQMDIAGGVAAEAVARGRTVTVAVTDLAFLRPVKVGDLVCCYTEPERIGRTSLALAVEAWVQRRSDGDLVLVTAARFTYVALDAAGRPRPVQPPAGTAPG